MAIRTSAGARENLSLCTDSQRTALPRAAAAAAARPEQLREMPPAAVRWRCENVAEAWRDWAVIVKVSLRRRRDADGRRRRSGAPSTSGRPVDPELELHGVARRVVLGGRLAGLDMGDEVARVALGVGVLAPCPAGRGRSAGRSRQGRRR